MKGLAALLVLGLIVLLLVVLLLNWFAPGQQELREQRARLALEQELALAPLRLITKKIFAVALSVGSLALATWFLVAALNALGTVKPFWTWSSIRAHLVRPTRHGSLYPAPAAIEAGGRITISNPVNELGAQRVAALTTGLAPTARLQGSAVRQILRSDDPQAMLEAPAARPALTLADATRVDPKTNPHWLMIGKTGSGKSTAMRHVLTIMAQRYPAEFVICEPNRGNWKDATHAWSVNGIAHAVEAVYKEQNRRADLLAAHATADHVMDLPGEKLTYLCLIFAEMDATMDNLYKLDRAQHRVTLVQLRDIARMGRKQGVCLFAESQAGLADVLDPNIARNFANIFLFNGSQQTAKTLGVSDLVSLPKLPVGTAFSMTHETTVEFSPIPRPQLRSSSLYQERGPLPLLPADAESDGLGDEDTPSTPSEPVLELVPELEQSVETPLEAASIPAPEPEPVLRHSSGESTVRRPFIPISRAPTSTEAAGMRMLYHRGVTKTDICFTYYGFKNDRTWDWVNAALENRI